MRISVFEDDAGFAPLMDLRARGIEPLVKLNGAIVTELYVADDTEGLIGHAQRDANGCLIITDDGCTRTHWVKGRVEISLLPAA